MSLSDLAAVGSFVSGLAVLVSLVFLYFQLRQMGSQIKQAEKNQKAAIGQGRTDRMVDLARRTGESDMSLVMINVLSDSSELSAQQLFQFVCHSRAIFLNAEDTFYQHENGLLEEEPYAGFVNAISLMLSEPPSRLIWLGIRGGFGPAFIRFVDQLIEKTPLAPLANPQERLSTWKAGIAAMMPRGNSTDAV